MYLERGESIDGAEEHRWHERLAQERARPGLFGARLGGKHAEHDHGNLPRRRILFQLAAELQAVELWNQDFSDDDLREREARAIQCRRPVIHEFDDEADALEKMLFEIFDM